LESFCEAARSCTAVHRLASTKLEIAQHSSSFFSSSRPWHVFRRSPSAASRLLLALDLLLTTMQTLPLGAKLAQFGVQPVKKLADLLGLGSPGVRGPPG